MTEIPADGKTDRRLSSWKEIAQFFGKDERTVKRWEQRGLPVRRVPRGARSSVFAYESELENWLRGKPAVEDPALVPPASAVATVAAPGPRIFPLVAAATVLAAMLGASSVAYFTTRTPEPAVMQQNMHIAPEEAQSLYREGVIKWNTRTAIGFEEAITAFNAAIEIDPDYGAAYAGLANVYNLISQYTGVPAAEAYAKAAQAADKAMALDPGLADGYAAKGFNLFYGSHQFAQSAVMFEEALKRGPESAQTLHWYALTSMHTGKFEKPLELIDRALVLSPDSRTIRANKALITFHAGHADEAITLLKALKQAEPDYLGTPSYLATIYLEQGNYPAFLTEYEEAARVAKSDSRLRIAAAARQGLSEGGKVGMLNAMFEAQKHEFEAGGEPAFKLAITAALLGDDALALTYLTKSVDKGEPDVLSICIEEAFRRLYGKAEFNSLLQKVGFEPPTS